VLDPPRARPWEAVWGFRKALGEPENDDGNVLPQKSTRSESITVLMMPENIGRAPHPESGK